MNNMSDSVWHMEISELFSALNSDFSGLSSEEAAKRLAISGVERLESHRKLGTFGLFLAQFKSPIILILISAAILSFFLHDPTDSLIILSIVLISGTPGFWQEKEAAFQKKDR